MAKGFRSFEIAPPYLYWYYSTPFPVLQTLFLVTMTISFPPQQAYSTNPKPALPSDDGRAGLLGAADGMRRGGSSILVGSGVGGRVVPPEHVLPQFRTHGLHRVLGQQGPLGVKEGCSPRSTCRRRCRPGCRSAPLSYWPWSAHRAGCGCRRHTRHTPPCRKWSSSSWPRRPC